jgi:hypothetical protein
MNLTTKLSKGISLRVLTILGSGLLFSAPQAGAATSTVTINGKATVLESVVVGGINATNAAQDTLVYKTLPPGGVSLTTLKYYTDSAAEKPTKFLWNMQKVAGLPFGKEAAFRVDLTCKK